MKDKLDMLGIIVYVLMIAILCLVIYTIGSSLYEAGVTSSLKNRCTEIGGKVQYSDVENGEAVVLCANTDTYEAEFMFTEGWEK